LRPFQAGFRSAQVRSSAIKAPAVATESGAGDRLSQQVRPYFARNRVDGFGVNHKNPLGNAKADPKPLSAGAIDPIIEILQTALLYKLLYSTNSFNRK